MIPRMSIGSAGVVARAVLVVLLAVGVAQAQTYRWTDKDGKVYYGDRPPPASGAAPPTPRSVPAAPRTEIRTDAAGTRVQQPQRPPTAKSAQQQEAEFQSRRAARLRAEEQQTKAAADAKARERRQRAEQEREAARTTQQSALQGERAANRRRQQDPVTRQRDVNRAYDDAWNRRKAGEGTNRTY